MYSNQTVREGGHAGGSPLSTRATCRERIEGRHARRAGELEVSDSCVATRESIELIILGAYGRGSISNTQPPS
jgi:hypothetical protein